MKTYIPVIGLEVHVELKTTSKMFCQCSADYFGKPPNTHVCPVCMGMPGALPVPNLKAIAWMQQIGVALGCTLARHSKFDRKHYNYPDLPKGYQISQYDEPFAVNGTVRIYSPYLKKEKMVRIHRVHMEEDTAKLLHEGGNTLIDFNRSSVPLVEIVTEPDFSDVEDVKAFLEELQVIIRTLGVSDADMEKGSMRLEPNISVMEEGAGTLPPYKVEVKNINSFRFVKQAVEYEVKRQKAILAEGKTPAQETRGWDDERQETYSQRTKENANDYRYFPEPDIPPFEFDEAYVNDVIAKVPPLPSSRYDELVAYGVRPIDAFILTRDAGMSAYVHSVLEAWGPGAKKGAQQAANAIINKKIDTHLSPTDFVAQLEKLHQPVKTDTALLSQLVDDAIGQQPSVVADYKKGKQNALMFLVGQVMKNGKGKVQAADVIALLKSKLSA